MTLNITEALVRQHASLESFQRGTEYHRGGAVLSMTLRGTELHAEVQGSEPFPYIVRAEITGDVVVDASCTCPYDWGGWCKHIVATLMAGLDEPNAIEELPTLESLLRGMDDGQVKELLLRLPARIPGLIEIIEREIERLEAAAVNPATGEEGRSESAEKSIDTQLIQRQVGQTLRSLDRLRPFDAYWLVGQVVEELKDILGQAWDLIGQRDERRALDVLDAFSQEYVRGWTVLDDSDGEASGFFADIGAAWAEAILGAELAPEDRRKWSEKLRAWETELEDYGMAEVFDAAIAAAEQGWDEPHLISGPQGDVPDGRSPSPSMIDYGNELTIASLNVLERHGRFEDYLRLARAQGETVRYSMMLVKLGRPEEAVEYGLEHLVFADDAFCLARVLVAQGAPENAVSVARRGLELRGHKADLAAWLCQLASSIGRHDLALDAIAVVVRDQPDLNTYLQAQELAGDLWPRYRDEMLDHIRAAEYPSPRGQVQVLLHERLVDDAIAKVEGGSARTLAAEVADAALTARPDWVIRTGRRYAEEVMNGGMSAYYDDAVQWLRRAMKGYRAGGQIDEWNAYLDSLITRHARKYKLRPMLERLRAAPA